MAPSKGAGGKQGSRSKHNSKKNNSTTSKRESNGSKNIEKNASGGKPKKKLTNDSESREANRPRNHLILDASTSFSFEYTLYGTKKNIIIHQTPNEETWPGGALWDLGVLLANVLVAWRGGSKLDHGPSCTLPQELDNVGRDIVWKNNVVLELGCGVGLTGLVAASLGAKLTILTDLQIVTSLVTQRNVEENSVLGPNKTCGYRLLRKNSGGGKVLAMPLCWGNSIDEDAVQSTLEKLGNAKSMTNRKKQTLPQTEMIFPDLIIIGDVAYQHKPGAPSHFEALLSTVLKFVGPHTKILFGTRMRMPASVDLLHLFCKHLHEVVAIEAHEVDPSLLNIGKKKHNMSIHVFVGKKTTSSETPANT